MDESLNIIRNKVKKTVWDKRDGSQRTLDKSDICPISGKWLIPANCIEIQPPKVEEGYKVFWADNEWKTEKTEEQIEKEEVKKYEPVVKSLQEQIEELKAEIEQLKFEKEEVKLDMQLEKERLLDDISNARKEALELSTNLILQKQELTKGADENGLESDMGNSLI